MISVLWYTLIFFMHTNSIEQSNALCICKKRNNQTHNKLRMKLYL